MWQGLGDSTITNGELTERIVIKYASIADIPFQHDTSNNLGNHIGRGHNLDQIFLLFVRQKPPLPETKVCAKRGFIDQELTKILA